MADGSIRPIEEVEVGERVLATDPETGEQTSRTVLATIIGSGSKHLVEITVDPTTEREAAGGETGSEAETEQAEQTGVPGPVAAGDVTIATDEHPFWVPDLGTWVDAIDLDPGTWLQTSAGTWVQVSAVQAWTQAATVHNLTVQGVHTFHVTAGSLDVLGHNCSDPLLDHANNVRNEKGVKFVSEYTSPSGQKYYGQNVGGQKVPPGALVDAVDKVGHHGGCAEVNCLIQAEGAEGSGAISGGSMRTIQSRNNSMPNSNTVNHGKPACPCQLCRDLFGELGVG